VLDRHQRSLDLCPFSDKVRQHLRLDRTAWCVCYVLPHQLEGPLGYPPLSLGVLDHFPERIYGHHYDGMRVEVVSELALGD
jgi:hypothetical protein